jgi:hypothetical protein
VAVTEPPGVTGTVRVEALTGKSLEVDTWMAYPAATYEALAGGSNATARAVWEYTTAPASHTTWPQLPAATTVLLLLGADVPSRDVSSPAGSTATDRLPTLEPSGTAADTAVAVTSKLSASSHTPR